MKRSIALLLALFLFTAGCTSKPVDTDGSLDSNSSALPAISSEEPTESLPDPSEETAASEPESGSEPAAAPTPATETTSSAPTFSIPSIEPFYPSNIPSFTDPGPNTPATPSEPPTPASTIPFVSALDDFDSAQVALMQNACIRVAEMVNAVRAELDLPALPFRDDLFEVATTYAKYRFNVSGSNRAQQYFTQVGFSVRLLGDSYAKEPAEYLGAEYGLENFALEWMYENWDNIDLLIANPNAIGIAVGCYGAGGEQPLFVVILVG